jgi:arabinan endo-1,5-alpha-L-arabinosidase
VRGANSALPAPPPNASACALAIVSTDTFPGPPYILQRCSEDGGTTWSVCGAVFPSALPAWVAAAVPKATSVWAPDVAWVPEVARWRV